MPCTPMPDSASRTSSSLNGLMMVVTSFMLSSWCDRAWPDSERLVVQRVAVLERQEFPGQAGVAFERVGLRVPVARIRAGVVVVQQPDVVAEVAGQRALVAAVHVPFEARGHARARIGQPADVR